MKSPDEEKQKPAFWAGSLNSGAGLGIEHLYNPMFYITKINTYLFLPANIYQQIIGVVNLNQ
ncbi:hypothetical protein [Klebsiella pneumoniae]|uniref:hypothetical protein n=1 Tax=Klebsiella pneumoniae TaxID=573 RepID=UPI0022706B43|nr:hypothetical protein [Klebsiella pneumoniae]MCX9898129.1 hypothetical protein [Klebsiella pneumoniae]